MSKIFICGTSGIGKTTLAQNISKLYDIPFIEGSSTVIWKEYNIRNHKELLMMGIQDPEAGLQFQLDLIRVREEKVRGIKDFVTDRSVIDNMVYFLYQNAPYLRDIDVYDYMIKCRESFNRIIDNHLGHNDNYDTKLIYLTRDFYEDDRMPIVPSDGKRIENTYYQDMMDKIFDHVIKNMHLGLRIEEGFSYLRMREYNFEQRMQRVYNFVKMGNDE